MSVFYDDGKCPLCGQQPPAGNEHPNYFLNCRTNEEDFVCVNPNCLFAYKTKIETDANGKPVWVETTRFPIEHGVVQRPKK